MKKLLGIAALVLAFAPFAQAQNSGEGLAGHPDARNDRQMEAPVRGSAVNKGHHGVKKPHHNKDHRRTHKTK